MQLEIQIEDYIPDDEMKSIIKENVAYAISKKFNSEEEIERLITNTCYEFVFKAVGDAIGENAEEKIKNTVTKLLEDDSHINYLLWRKKDAWESQESPAITIMNSAIESNKELIEQRVADAIKDFDFSEAKDEIFSVTCDAIEKKLFGTMGE